MISFLLKHKNHFWLLVALVVAFGLRGYALSAQSFWNDEGTSVALSSLSLEAITNGAARDIHPPLYYYLLHFWMPIVGNTEYAVRFLSVMAGVLTVAFVFRIAHVFFDVEVAILAAYLTAFAPFLVSYSQEARMYIWVTLWSTVSVWAMASILNSKFGIQNSGRELRIANCESRITNYELRFTLLYLAATLAALYTQYVGAFVVVAENLAFAIWWILAVRHSRFTAGPVSRWHIGSLAHWLIVQSIIGAFFLPWYLFAGGQLAAWPSISEPFDLPTLIWRVLNVFSVGLTLDAATAAPIAIAFGILFLLGWRRTQNPTTNWVTGLLILWALVPVAVMYGVSLARPAYNPKFLLLAMPAFLILVARGLARIYPGLFVHSRRQHLGSLRYLYFSLAVLAVIGFIPSLRNYYADPRYARDDYRAIVQFINEHARADDGVLINAPGQIDVVRYYLRANPQLFLLPRMRPADPGATRTDIDEMLRKAKRVFGIFWATDQSDPQRLIETRLAENAFKARDEWHGNVRFVFYGVAPAERPRGAAHYVGARVGGEIALQSFQQDATEFQPGAVLTLTVNWRAEQTPSARYKVFVHLLNAHNQVVAQRDGEPVGDLRITTTWRGGEEIADNYGVWIEPGTPPGDYRLELGMYRADDGARLPIISRTESVIGDHIVLGVVRIK